MIQDFLEELITWNKTHNLVSKNEIHNLQEHIDDSLSLIPVLQKYSHKIILDIGSGGGFPVIPLAIYAKENNLDFFFRATDIVEKKLTFLKWCTAKFELPIEIINMNYHYIDTESDAIISRAFSSIPNILKWRDKHAPHILQFHLLKGDTVAIELEEAKIDDYQTVLNPRGCIVSFQSISKYKH